MSPSQVKLSNGLTVLFIPHKDVNSVVIQLRGNVGSNLESKSEIGAAHLTEHIILNQIRPDVGGEVFGVTSRDDGLIMIKSLNSSFNKNIGAIAYHTFTPVFTKNNLELQKKLSFKEIDRHKNSPEKHLIRISNKTLYQSGRMSVLNTGEKDDIRKLSLSNIRSFHKRHYHASNFVLAISGNVNKNRALSLAKKYFSSIPLGIKSKSPNHYQDNSLQITNKVMPNLSQTYVKIDFYGFPLKNKRRYALSILSQILNLQIMQLINTKLGMSYKLSCFAYSSGTYGILSIVATLDEKDIDEFFNVIRSFIYQTPKNFGDKNIRSAIDRIVRNLLFDFDKTSLRADFYSQMRLHISKQKSYDDEIVGYKNTSKKAVVEALKYIKNQEPKITVISGKNLKNKIEKIFK